MNINTRIFENDLSSPAFLDDAGTCTTYGQLHAAVSGISRQLKANGCYSGDRIALTVPRGPLGLIGFLSISSFAICCPLDPKMRDEEMLESIDRLSLTSFVDFTGDPRIEAVAAKSGIRCLRPPSDVMLNNSGPGGAPPSASSAGDVALLLQTSGTTSKPKLVALTHGNLAAAASGICTAYNIGSEDVCLNPMPHYHVHGLISAGLSSLVAGASQFCATSFSAPAFQAVFERLCPTWFTGSPAFHLGLVDHFKFAEIKPRNRRLRFIRSSSAPFPASMIGPFEELFGAPLLENYGMTETASTICSNPPPPRKRKSGSVGLPLGSKIRLVAPDGQSPAAGDPGEILLKGPSVIGYYGSTGSDDGNFLDGWLRTGDIGRFDEDGYLYVLGRTKELIKRGGHSVYPLEVDNALVAYSDIAEAICFAIQHPTLGEELVAVVVPRPGSRISMSELRDSLELKLSTYKIPSAIYVVPKIPKNDTGKAVRRDMARHFDWLHAPKAEPCVSLTEQTLVQIWRDVIGRSDLGATDNVFVFGADTLRAQRACDVLTSQGGGELDLRMILKHPTVREQAAAMMNGRSA